ncbi:MAG TPA: PAS domain S-box protein [Polyangia bacterium]|jgi:PAS domain S-box-containing protein
MSTHPRDGATELTRTRRDLAGTASLVQAVLEAAAEGILAVDLEGRVRSYNRQFLELWGLEPSALEPGDRAALDAVLPKVKEPARFRDEVKGLSARPDAPCHDTVELADGRIFERHALPQRLGDAVVGRVWSFRDVTRKARTEAALRQGEELFKVAFFGIPDVAGIADLETGRFIEVNDGCERVLGWRRDEVLGRTAAELPIWPSRAERARVIHGIERMGEVAEAELELRRRDGQTCRLAGAARVVELQGRRCVVMLLRDVTERRRLEAELRALNADLERRVRERTAQLEREIAEHRRAEELLSRSEHNYRELVESANSIILRWDTAGQITFLNEYGQRFFGFPPGALLGRSVIGTIVPETETSGRDLAAFMARIATHPDEFIINENENIRCSGERVWIAWTNRPVLDAAGRLVETLSVGNDISALKHAERELVRAKEAAESADRLKSAFLATMSHELRTPLNSIIGFTGILLQGLAGPLNDEQARQLGMVQDSSRHLHALINDVLDLSKIEAGQLTIAQAPFDYRAAATKVCGAMEPLARKKGLALRLTLAPEVGGLVSDQRRVEQVLVNLVANAIKFTERGAVDVTVTVRDGAVVTAVRDTGIGVKPEDQAILFRPFQQVDTGLTRRHEGTGLGLSICRKLLALLGGTIGFTSTFGVGSEFTFAVPQAAGAAP